MILSSPGGSFLCTNKPILRRRQKLRPGDGGTTQQSIQIERNGYHLKGIPFECDLCQSRNVNERDPINGNARYNHTLLCIRRAIIDAFWSQETSTVSGNFRKTRQDYFDSIEVLIIRRPMPIIGTNKVRYQVCMVFALHTLDDLGRKGKWQDKLQWDSMRRNLTWNNNA